LVIEDFLNLKRLSGISFLMGVSNQYLSFMAYYSGFCEEAEPIVIYSYIHIEKRRLTRIGSSLVSLVICHLQVE
jgi:hypothetical protein